MSRSGPSAHSAGTKPLRTAAGALLIAILATIAFAANLPAEPSFVDEWAYLSQTYYADLWLHGATDHVAWLDYPAYDLPPLPKYLFGLALRVGGYPRPGPGAAQRWYQNTSARCGPMPMLVAARYPSVLLGSLGCVALYGLGTLARGRCTGIAAALLLMVNPLYRMHARRAMSDVIAESLILIALCAGLYAWSRWLANRSPVAAGLSMGLAGIAGGMAALAKLNGALAMIVIAAWAALAILLPRFSWQRKGSVAGGAVVAGLISLATFTALNPFLTAHPRGPLSRQVEALARKSLPQRMVFLAEIRMDVSEGQKTQFPHNALDSATEKLATVAVQGFGRFGPFGPRDSKSWIRYDRAQDWGAALWLPLVAAGAWTLARLGRRQLDADAPPTAWAILTYAVVSAIVVTSYLPLAWDRYYLSIQPGSSLLAAAAITTAVGRLRDGFTKRRGSA